MVNSLSVSSVMVEQRKVIREMERLCNGKLGNNF